MSPVACTVASLDPGCGPATGCLGRATGCLGRAALVASRRLAALGLVAQRHGRGWRYSWRRHRCHHGRQRVRWLLYKRDGRSGWRGDQAPRTGKGAANIGDDEELLSTQPFLEHLHAFAQHLALLGGRYRLCRDCARRFGRRDSSLIGNTWIA